VLLEKLQLDFTAGIFSRRGFQNAWSWLRHYPEKIVQLERGAVAFSHPGTLTTTCHGRPNVQVSALVAHHNSRSVTCGVP